MLLMKIWYEYFNLAQTEVRNVGSALHKQINEITQSIKNLVQRVQTELENLKTRDVDVIKVKQGYHKTLDVLEMSTKKLYREESKNIAMKLKLETLEDNLLLVYPNCMNYLVTKSTIQERKCTHPNEDVDPATLTDEEKLAVVQAKQERDRQVLQIENKNNEIAAFWSRIISGCGKPWDQREPGEEELKNEPNQLQVSNRQLVSSDEKPGLHQEDTGPINQSKKWSELLQKGNWSIKDPYASRNVPGADQLPEEAVYRKVVEDIERILKVIPVKTLAQQQLDEALSTIKQLHSRIDQEVKIQARQEKEIKALHERCNELTITVVEQHEKYMQQIQTLKRENELKIEEVKRLE